MLSYRIYHSPLIRGLKGPQALYQHSTRSTTTAIITNNNNNLHHHQSHHLPPSSSFHHTSVQRHPHYRPNHQQQQPHPFDVEQTSNINPNIYQNVHNFQQSKMYSSATSSSSTTHHTNSSYSFDDNIIKPSSRLLTTAEINARRQVKYIHYIMNFKYKCEQHCYQFINLQNQRQIIKPLGILCVGTIISLPLYYKYIQSSPLRAFPFYFYTTLIWLKYSCLFSNLHFVQQYRQQQYHHHHHHEDDDKSINNNKKKNKKKNDNDSNNNNKIYNNPYVWSQPETVYEKFPLTFSSTDIKQNIFIMRALIARDARRIYNAIKELEDLQEEKKKILFYVMNIKNKNKNININNNKAQQQEKDKDIELIITKLSELQNKLSLLPDNIETILQIAKRNSGPLYNIPSLSSNDILYHIEPYYIIDYQGKPMMTEFRQSSNSHNGTINECNIDGQEQRLSLTFKNIQANARMERIKLESYVEAEKRLIEKMRNEIRFL